MPFSGERLARFREVKGIRTQGELAELTGIAQPRVSVYEKGKQPSIDVVVKLADRLDCTTDFLLGRGPHRDATAPDELRHAASRMAFDAYAEIETSDRRQEWCRRVLGHRAAPLSVEQWTVLAEQIERAVGPSNGGATLHSLQGGKAG